jgi:hypothetical protein
VVVLMQVAPAQAIAAHGVVDIAALDVTTAKAGGGGDMWVGASGGCHFKSEMATVDEDIREAEVWCDREDVQIASIRN